MTFFCSIRLWKGNNGNRGKFSCTYYLLGYLDKREGDVTQYSWDVYTWVLGYLNKGGVTQSWNVLGMYTLGYWDIWTREEDCDSILWCSWDVLGY